jgi:hypothetical protein
MDTQHYEKYVIFLSSRFFNKSTIFKSMYQKIRKRLQNKGIKTFNINDITTTIEDYKLLNKLETDLETLHKKYITNQLDNNSTIDLTLKRSFDEMECPCENVLYIHLFGGQYYNDKIYPKKKLEIERDLLFFIAGNLGVNKINYTIHKNETAITSTSTGLRFRAVGNKITYTKSILSSAKTECVEKYENNGAPLYFNANNNIDTLEGEIKNTFAIINSEIFNYRFYKSNPKLVAFVCKRFLFKMKELDYTSESEDLSELSFTVQSCFADYGLQVSYEKIVTVSETISYKLKFFSEDELQKVFFTKNYRNSNDNFYLIRKFCDEDTSDNKQDGYLRIKDYVFGIAENLHYKVKDAMTVRNFIKKLSDYIRNHSEHNFMRKCLEFRNTLDIKCWFYNELLDHSLEEIDDETNVKDTVIHLEREREFEQKPIYKQSIPVQKAPIQKANLVQRTKSANTNTHLNITIQETQIDLVKDDEHLEESNGSNIDITNNMQLACIPASSESINTMTSLHSESTSNSENELVNKYSVITSLIDDKKEVINVSKQKQLSQDRMIDDMINSKLYELNICKNSIKSLNKKKLLEQIKNSGGTNYLDKMCMSGGNSERSEKSFKNIKAIFQRNKSNIVSEIIEQLDKKILLEKNNCQTLENEIQLLKTDKETANIYINTMIKEFDELIEERNTLESLLAAQGIKVNYGLNNSSPRKISNTYEINV